MRGSIAERAGDVDALLLAARQLVRIARAEQIRIEADLAQHLARDPPRLGLRACRARKGRTRPIPAPACAD